MAATHDDSEVVAAVIEELANWFEVQVVDLRKTREGVTALLRVSSTSLEGETASGSSPDGQVTLMPVEKLD